MQSSSSPYGRQTWEAGTEAAVLSPYGSRTPIAVGRHFCHFWNHCAITANLCRLSFVHIMECDVG
jgi:hypothetical protein